RSRAEPRGGLQKMDESVQTTHGAGEQGRLPGLSRRGIIGAMGAGAALLAGRTAFAQGGEGPMAPPSTVTTPPRDFVPNGAPTTYFWDPDIIAVDPIFNSLVQPNAPIQRLWTGALWME